MYLKKDRQTDRVDIVCKKGARVWEEKAIVEDDNNKPHPLPINGRT